MVEVITLELVVALAAVVTAVLAWRKASAAKEQTEIMRRAFQKQLNAEGAARITVDQSFDGRTQRIVVYNQGPAVAEEVSIAVKGDDPDAHLGIYGDELDSVPLTFEEGGLVVINRAISSAAPLSVWVTVRWKDGCGPQQRSPERVQVA